VTSRTGWTPAEIAQLTLGQLNVYIKSWIGTGETKQGEGFNDLEMFNIMSGIPKKIVSKK
jgi:hypothetical protein